MASVEIRGVKKSFGAVEVIHGIDVTIADEEFVVLVGPSGCGKSTLLRMVAGLEQITGGEIEIGGRVVNNLPPKDRDIAMVFQNYALYPHMKVRDNMAFSLLLAKRPRAEVDERVMKAASILGLAELLDRYPRQLSGGRRQRGRRPGGHLRHAARASRAHGRGAGPSGRSHRGRAHRGGYAGVREVRRDRDHRGLPRAP